MASVKNEQTIIGNIGNIYELRRVGADKRAVIDFSVAITPSVRDANGNWGDGETTWVNCTVWDRLAENVEKSFKKGDRVIVIGKVRTKPEFTKEDGTVIPARDYLSVDYAGLELFFSPAHSDRNGSNGGSRNDRSASSSSADRSERKAPAAKKPAAKKETANLDDLDDFDLDDEPF